MDLYGWLFVASAVALLARVLMVPSAIMMNDEYYYAKTTYLWFIDQAGSRHITSLPTRGEAEFPNALFFALYRISYFFGQNFYVGAKLLNVVLGTLMALTVRVVARQFVDRRFATGIAILALWLPSTSYFTYFVPEPLYELLVWAGLAFYFVRLSSTPTLAHAVLGGCLGAAFLAKPNAVALLAAVNVVVVVVGAMHEGGDGMARRIFRHLLAVNLAFVAAAYLLNVLATGSVVWDPVGKFYKTGLSKLGEIDARQSFLATFTKYSAAYALALGFMLGPPLTVLLVRATRAKGTIAETALLAMSLIGVGVLLLGSAKVATNWERVYQNHADIYSTRYMSVLFPLLLITFVRFLPSTHELRARRLAFGIAIAAVTVLLALYFRHMPNTFQMREVMWPREIHRWAYRITIASSAAVTLYYAMRRRPGPGVYATGVSVLSVLAVLTILRRDVQLVRHGEHGRDADLARALTELVPPAEQDHGVIVAPSNRGAALFMFQYPGIDSLIVTANPRSVTAQSLPASASWIVFVGEGDPGFAPSCVRLRSGTFCPLSAAAVQHPSVAAPLSR
jgi:hypothetical protein